MSCRFPHRLVPHFPSISSLPRSGRKVAPNPQMQAAAGFWELTTSGPKCGGLVGGGGDPWVPLPGVGGPKLAAWDPAVPLRHGGREGQGSCLTAAAPDRE